MDWNLAEVMKNTRDSSAVHTDIDKLAAEIVRQSEPGDQIIVMSNGGFGGIHEKILSGLETRFAANQGQS